MVRVLKHSVSFSAFLLLFSANGKVGSRVDHPSRMYAIQLAYVELLL